ncbi:ATP-binding endoribonuclease [Colletotrichum musicola]|uniref:Diphthine--ammonia ligase n=1 Tax=Colletotrichum musicola TaxID=2175873 RepID=A0A8H6U5D7_9PEZI|nr:ATP-binding endoribonuclease [Colletotrichum musicola]
MSSEQLNVIALVSGGKDSFFSALHCQRNGHRVVALANLFPAAPAGNGSDAVRRSARGTLIYTPRADHVKHASDERLASQEDGPGEGTPPEDTDLNSFMYQTVGHQVIPLYADATGLPLYRQPIDGGARYEGRDYDSQAAAAGDETADETESMIPLLRTVMENHPEANALCAGAILSTYQRTRVESIALRLGLTPLAYLWKYPVLPPVSGAVEDAQLLHDMAAAGLDARIIKVASAGLDEDFLWERVSSLAGAARIKRALRRFGASGGSVLGEGGEFETIVLDGPPGLFCSAVEVPESGRRVVKEGGGTSWLSFEGASVREKPAGESFSPPRVPDVLDPRFQALLDSLPSALDLPSELAEGELPQVDGKVSASVETPGEYHWTVEADVPLGKELSVEEETEDLVKQIRNLLSRHSPPLPTTAITHTVIVLRRMSDFPAINEIYGGLFSHPNPPSRVTISCGDGLPEGKSIGIHLTVKPDLKPSERNGLHVQSRSYWAPANIGPYSQAIDVPLNGVPQGEQGSVRSVTIAGQIPLVPASMILPAEGEGNTEMQIVLSLQHLWRIALDMKVQLWTSAVAYFPSTPDTDVMRRQAQLAAASWIDIHAHGADEDEDDEAGPDLWDRKFNPQYMSLGGGDDADAEPKLPDWDAVKTAGEDAPKPVPPFFAVEVEELPRQAGVEWHAHLGLSQVPSAAAEYLTSDMAPSDEVSFRRRVSHFVVSGAVAHTTVSWLASKDPRAKTPASFDEVDEGMRRAYLQAIGGDASDSAAGFPYLMYVNGKKPAFAPAKGGFKRSEARTTAFVPAKSIWGAGGEEVLAVGLFK